MYPIDYCCDKHTKPMSYFHLDIFPEENKKTLFGIIN